MPPPAAPPPLIGPVQPSASGAPVVEAKSEVDPMPDDDDLVLQVWSTTRFCSVGFGLKNPSLGKITFFSVPTSNSLVLVADP